MLRLTPATSASRALKPLVAFLWVTGLFTMRVRFRSRLRTNVKKLLNVLFVSCSVLAHGCHVTFHFLALITNIRTGRNLIPSLYTSTFALGMLYVSVTKPLTTPRHFRKMLTMLDSYHEQYDSSRDFLMLQKFVTLICVADIFTTPMLSPLLLNAVVSLSGLDNATCVAMAEDDLHLPTYLTYTVSIYAGLTYSFAWIEACVFCFILLSVASRFVKDLQFFKADILESSPRILEDFRLRHESLCKLIGQTSLVIGHIIAAVYVSGIPCFLFLLHGFVYRQLALYEFLRMIFFFVQLTCSLFFFSVAGTMLNIKMHKPAEFLFPLNIEKMPGRGPEIVAAFLSRLQGAPIGFTVYRLFTIDTSTILMVCGTILTYAVVIIQFQPGVGGTSALSAPSLDVIAATTPSPLAASADLIVALNSSTG